MCRLYIGLVLVAAACGQVQDQTRVAGAHGSEIVQAVVSRIRESCIFPDDKLFLRRLAFVETHDGDDADTYRPGYDGGIWKIDRDHFEQTKTSSQASALFSAISSQFAMDWRSVQWSDLRKPLYSGLAAALFLSTISEQVERNLEKQGPYYAKYFRSIPDAAHNYFVEAQKINQNTCSRTNLDLAFLIDSSTSLSAADLANAKKFAANVVENFKISRDDVRVAFLTFSDGFKEHFDFNRFNSKKELKDAINGVNKVNGLTDTDAALDYATNTLFTSAKGSRDGAAKVILLLTDGESTHPFRTVPAALHAKSKGILIFAIGVGKTINVQELTDAASKPDCTHVIQLAGYSDLSALVQEIQEVSCSAAAVLGPGSYTFQCSKGGLYQFVTNGSLTQVTITTTDGLMNVYGSLSNPTPSQAVNSFASVASNLASSVILINKEYKPVYTSVVNPGAPNGCKGNFTIRIGGKEKVKANTQVSCVESDKANVCSPASIYAWFYTLISPPYNFNNPCKVGIPVFMEQPGLQTSFIFCDVKGKDYSFNCNPHEIYGSAGMFCVRGEVTTPTTPRPVTHAPAHTDNPCNGLDISKGVYVFPYPPDEKKFIDCTEWPALGYIKDCPPRKVWDDLDKTCNFKDVVINSTDLIFSGTVNPCKNPLHKEDLFYYPHPTDAHKYIHCDAHGDAYEKTCPNDMFWRQRLLQCIPDSLKILG